MSQEPLQPEFVAQAAELHIAGRHIQFWTFAADRIGTGALLRSALFKSFHAFVSRFVKPAPNGPIGFDLTDLSDAQKWLVMATVAEFLDQDMIYPEEEESKRRRWAVVTRDYARAFDYLCAHPNVLNPRLHTTWETFRAAVS